jgi:hypothetical protein
MRSPNFISPPVARLTAATRLRAMLRHEQPGAAVCCAGA